MHIKIRYWRLFNRILILLCIVFVVEVGYLGKCMWNRRHYIASLDIPKSHEALPGDMLVAEESESAMQEIFYKSCRNRALSMKEKFPPKLDSTYRWIVRYKNNQQRGQNEKDARRRIKGKSGLGSNQRREDDSDEEIKERLPRHKKHSSQ